MNENQPERSGRRPSDGERPQRRPGENGRRPRRTADGERPRRTADGERPRRTADGERPRRTADGERPRRTADGERPRRTADGERPRRTAEGERPRRTAAGTERSSAQRNQEAQKQTIIRSVAAVAVIALFLIVGKIFFWNKDTTKNTQKNDNTVSVAEVGVTTTAEVTTTTAETTTVTTTVTTAENHFETYPPEGAGADASAQTQAVTDAVGADGAAAQTEAAATTAPAAPAKGFPVNAPEGYFSDALFIGDSRTVGQACFGPIDGATYFATVGLATYKINEALSEVPGTEGMSFDAVLSMKQFTKVYIMLGINELGNDLTTTMNNFRDLIARIQQAQPNAVIIIEANLHVSATRHNSDALVNNTVINSFNAGLAQLADNNKVYYIDVNPVFDDANGCLTAEYTSDGTHPYAKHYADWADFIRRNAVVK